MDGADQAEFQHFQKYLNRIFEKYGPDVWADAYADLVREAAQHATGTSRESCCSFCGKRKSEVADRMVNGPGVFICIACIDLCHKVRRQEWPDQT